MVKIKKHKVKVHNDGTIDYRVKGTVDDGSKFNLKRKGIPPSEPVRPELKTDKPQIDTPELPEASPLSGSNSSGTHSQTTTQGIDRSNTLGNQDVDHPAGGLKGAAEKAKGILAGDGTGSSTSTPPTETAPTTPTTPTTPPTETTPTTPPTETTPTTPPVETPDGLVWFATNWKTVALVAGAAAIIAGIAKLIKVMNKEIKVRYNKCVRTLQKVQHDFTLSPDGLNMKAVMPGVGSKMFDKIAGWFNRGAKKASSNGNIGLHPFCQQYKDDIAQDFRAAEEAFNKIRVAADQAGEATDQSESFKGRVYESFYEALSEDAINEGEELNEIGAMAAISAAISLGGLAVKAGTFLFQKMKNGKPDGEAKAIQVTKQSTREICYSIINNYANKYVNMEQVFKQLGIDTKSLADLDTSTCDKLSEILQKYQKPEPNVYTKQYSRIQKAYENMLKHYFNIGDGIIKNFVKYTKADDEKHENLLVASKEKLENMWDSQKEFYIENFSRIVIEIISSDAYIGYLNFILEKVMPVFKSGLAGDADYVLDVMPKKGEYYVLRQTNEQPWLESGEVQKGQIAIAEVVDYDKDNKGVTFNLVGLLKDPTGFTVNDSGVAEISSEIDFNAYTTDGKPRQEKLEYGKWISLDPAITEWRPVGEKSKVYTYITKKGVRYVVYATKDIRDTNEGFSIVYVAVINPGMGGPSRVIKISLKSNITLEAFESVFEKLKDFSGEDVNDGNKRLVDAIASFTGEMEPEEAESSDKIVEIISKVIDGGDGDVNAMYVLNYETSKGNKETMYVFPTTSQSNKDAVSNVYIAKKNAESEGYVDVHKVDLDPALLMNAFTEIFTTEGRIKGKEGETFAFDATETDNAIVDGVLAVNEPKTEVAKSSDGLIKIIAKLLTGCKPITKPISPSENPIDDILGKLDELTKVIDEGVKTQGETLKKLKAFDGHDGVQISENGWVIPTGVKDKEGNEISFEVVALYLANQKKIVYLVGFKGSNYDTYAVAETFDTNAIVEAIKRLCDAKKQGKGLAEVAGYLKGANVKDNTWANVEKRLLTIAEAVVARVQFKPMDPQNPNEPFGLIDTKKMLSVNGLNIEFQNTQTEQWVHVRDSGIFYTRPDMTWDNPVTFSIGVSVESIKNANGGAVPCKVSITPKVFVDRQIDVVTAKEKLAYAFREVCVKYGKEVDDAKFLVSGDYAKLDDAKKKQWTSAKESVNVTYSHKVVNEGMSTDTVITRTFSTVHRGAYVLSESYFDLGKDTSKLSDVSFVRKFKTRNDVFEYVKNNINAKIYNLTESQTYRVSSNEGYRPSVMTPLYENVYIVKFGSDDRVSSIRPLGKYKIQ